MVKIKLIDNDDYLTLLKLYTKMYKIIDHKLNSFQVSLILNSEISRKDYYAIGLYKDNKLIGYVSMYAEDEDTMFITGSFIPIALYVRRLFDEVENHIKSLGYKAWTTEYNKNDGKCLAPKIGAKEFIIKYKKEL